MIHFKRKLQRTHYSNIQGQLHQEVTQQARIRNRSHKRLKVNWKLKFKWKGGWFSYSKKLKESNYCDSTSVGLGGKVGVEGMMEYLVTLTSLGFVD